MKDENKTKIMSIFIGLVMVLSLAGFAGLSLVGRADVDQNQNTGPEIPNIVYRELEPDEVLYSLQNGRVVMEYTYAENCETCEADELMLTTVVNRFLGHIILQSIEGEETSLRMTGVGGSIIEVEDVTEDNVIDVFCQVAPIKPRECLVRDLV